jgi:hypothetical protein
LRNTSRSKFTQIPFIFISKNSRKAEKILGKNPKSIGPQTLLESFYFQILGSLENLSHFLVLQNSLKFTFLPSQIFYNFLEIFGIFTNYLYHPNFLIHFPKSRNQFLMDFLFLFFSSPAGLPISGPWPASQPKPTPNHPAHLASQPLGPRVPLAYFAEDVFFFDSRLSFSAPFLSPLADAWAPLVSSFFHPAPVDPGCATVESRRVRPLRAAAQHLEMPPRAVTPPSPPPLFKSHLNPP